MKNILWFLHKPVDEREQVLYSKAYQRALGVILISFVLLIIVFSLFQLHTVPGIGTVVPYVFWIILVIADVTGWNTLREEEIEVTDVLSTSLKVKYIFFAAVVVILSQIAITFVFPELYLIAGFVTLFGLQGILIVFAWIATPKVFLPFRILLTVLFPLYVIVFLKLKRKNLVIRFFESVVISFFLVTIFIGGLFIINMFLLRGRIVTPVYISTAYFEPDLPEKSMQYVDLRDRNFQLHDFVTFIGDDGKLRVGKIIAVDTGMVSIENSNGVHSLKMEEINGRILDKDQGAAKVNSLFERFLMKSSTE